MRRAAVGLGVTIDGFAVEGGFDTDEGPATSFGVMQALGRARPSLRAEDAYAHLEDLVERAASLGFTELRLTVEWARLERRPDERDEGALDRYARALGRARDLAMSCTVVLCDAAWPSWLGQEPWLSEWAPRRFAVHASWVAARLAGMADAYVTFRAPNAAATSGWLDATRPPYRRRAGADALSALDGMLLAHQLAVNEIERVASQARRAIVMDATATASDDAAWRHLVADLAPQPATAPRLRSARRWKDVAGFEWWLAGRDPAALANALAHARGAVRTVELGCAAGGWAAQLAAGVPSVTSGPFGASTVHLHGLVSSTGPLAAPIGLVDVDRDRGGWSMRALDPTAARALASLTAPGV